MRVLWETSPGIAGENTRVHLKYDYDPDDADAYYHELVRIQKSLPVDFVEVWIRGAHITVTDLPEATLLKSLTMTTEGLCMLGLEDYERMAEYERDCTPEDVILESAAARNFWRNVRNAGLAVVFTIRDP